MTGEGISADTNIPAKVKLVEVGPRDGLQNEASPVSAAIRIELIERLAAAGLPVVESFVSPRWVPRMAGSDEIFRSIERRKGTIYPALVPNLKGLEAALAVGVEEIAVFVSATEGFSRNNITCSRAESLERLAPVLEEALAQGLTVRGYISCIAGCPYDGEVAEAEVLAMSRALIDGGCYEISLGDTIDVGTAGKIRRVIDTVAKEIRREKIAMHFHDIRYYGLPAMRAPDTPIPVGGR